MVTEKKGIEKSVKIYLEELAKAIERNEITIFEASRDFSGFTLGISTVELKLVFRHKPKGEQQEN